MLNKRFDRYRAAVVVTAAAAALLSAGCSSIASSRGDNKAGGSAEPVVLRLANTSFGLLPQPAVQYFVDRVKELSGGAFRVDTVDHWGDYDADAEQQVVRDVAAGKVQLGWVGTNVFDTLGITGFQALTAPMLIDNYPLQRAVLASDIPAEMLAGLDKVGVDGVAVLGDGLRKPIAVSRPLLGPADYHGITFEAFRSQDHAAAIAALGAIPTDVFGPNLDAGLRSGDIDGFEKGLHIYKILDATAYLAPYVTANVNLWPHTLALIANPHTMSGLTEMQRGWLARAGSDAASRSTDLTDDAELVADLCKSGTRFANASDTDLAAMRHAFAPVYAQLDNDSTTKDFIDRIEALKQSTDPGPALDIPSACTGPAASKPVDAPVAAGASSDSLDGTYRWTITADDALAHGTAGDTTPENLARFPAIFTITMAHGTWRLRERDGAGDKDDGGGTYAIAVDQISFHWQTEGDSVLSFVFTVDDDGTLHLDPHGPMNPGDQFIWATDPWTKID